MPVSIPPRLWTLGALLAWGGAILLFGLIRVDTYGLDEGAALALLLNWSVADMIANPVITFGGPDFRALLFMPLGLYWSGSMLAAKIFTLLVCFGAALLLYRWTQRHEGDGEAALLATGLLLVSPALLGQADAIGSGPYLLAMFGLGWLLDQKYRTSEHQISSLYFLQTLLVAITVTLHPMGLAYPLALVWRWQQDPKSEQQKRQVWIGIAIATGIILAMRTGWVAIPWFSDPLASLSYAVIGNPGEDPAATNWLAGLVPALLLVIVLIKSARQLLGDVFGASLLLAALIGLLTADHSWSLIALAVLLYAGTPLLIRLNQGLLGGKAGFFGQRGLVMILLFVSATIFMQADRAYATWLSSGQLSTTDELIQALTAEAANHDQPFLAASQWPARSMIACRRDVLPLPPIAADGPAQLKMIKGITHLIFDHNNPDFSALAKNFAALTDATETLNILPGGVLLKVREVDSRIHAEPKPAPPVQGDTPAIPDAPKVDK